MRKQFIVPGLIFVAIFHPQRSIAAPLDPSQAIFTSQSQGNVELAAGGGYFAFNLGTSTPTLDYYNGPLFQNIATGFVNNGINVFDFQSFRVDAGVAIIVNQSSRSGPLAILSSTSIDVAGSIDVSSGTTFSYFGGGPGAQTQVSGGNGSGYRFPGQNGPGSIGESGGGGGGFGGIGTKGGDVPDVISNSGVPLALGGAGGSAANFTLSDRLIGGTTGGTGGGGFSNASPGSPAAGGFGGGAIELAALGTISISGQIKADGSNGTNVIDSGSSLYAGGGGGSGGGIYVHADNVNVSGKLEALGGKGGTGSSRGVIANGGDGGGGMILVQANKAISLTGSLQVGNGNLGAFVVPEPSSFVLLGSAIAIFGGLGRLFASTRPFA